MKSYLQLIILLFLSKIAYAANVYVDVNGNNPTPPYSSWNTASTTIQDAVIAASEGDTILVTNGVYRLTSEIVVDKNIEIRSVHGPDVTITDGQTYSRVFNLSDSSSVISGIHITRGYINGTGGGVNCSQTSFITNCIISENTATGSGGGVYRGKVKNSIIRNN